MQCWAAILTHLLIEMRNCVFHAISPHDYIRGTIGPTVEAQALTEGQSR